MSSSKLSNWILCLTKLNSLNNRTRIQINKLVDEDSFFKKIIQDVQKDFKALKQQFG